MISTTPRYANLPRIPLVGPHTGYTTVSPKQAAEEHRRRVRQELRDVGLGKIGLKSMESHFLPTIIHPNERIGGAVYGLHEDGLAMLVATDRRVVFVDKKPLFANKDEVNYYVISGIKLSEAGPAATLTLHTRIRDYTFRILNSQSAYTFVEYIENRCLEHQQAGYAYDRMTDDQVKLSRGQS